MQYYANFIYLCTKLKSKNTNKMDTIAEKIRKKHRAIKNPFVVVAEKFETEASYVRQIARGERNPIRGKGLKIKRELEKMAG